MLKILHVDRSELFRKVMRELISRCGQTIVSVSSKTEALAALIEGPFDLVVTGLELGDGDAELLIREMAETGSRDVPVMVVTATDSLELRERLFALGVVDYMLKGTVTEDQFRRYFDALAAEDELSRYMRGLRIAVLDDSQEILKIVLRILTMHGFTSVRLFSDPAELFDSGETFDLYLTDSVLPTLSLEQAVARIRREAPESIVIGMSNFSGEKPLSNLLLAGVDDYIHKPFDAAGFISRLKVNARAYQLKKRLERMAVTDALTEVYNHRYSFERLEEETAKACRYSRPLSILMLDVDDLKHVNDIRGHRAGDEVLRALSRSLKGVLRSTDVIGRYAGEEFLVILPETTLDAANIAAKKIRSAVSSLLLDGGSLVVSVSCGVAEYRHDESVESFIARVDYNLYKSKRGGKSKVKA
jgi:two-component system cell cycle response regulator